MNEQPEVIARSAGELLGGLNEQQAEAVQYDGPALLIAAGAGSGKTRVLTRRIAWLLSQTGAWPSQILAITFTNKAAAEMKERLTTLIGPVAQRMWVSTFHSACVRILRRDGGKIGLKSGFSIYDTADSQRLVKIICTELNIDVKRYTPRSILARISDYKNSLIGWQERLKQYAPQFKPGVRGSQIGSFGDVEVLYACVYAEYQYRLATANAVDFDDLIMRTVELLRTDPVTAEYYRRKFRYILVDEYQDTNHAQYVLVRELGGVDCGQQREPGARGAGRMGPAWITVVGDSDQSIYAFRGADIRNIQEFEKDFPNARTILLEQNYRSTQTILNAANAVIALNPGRKPKKLWTALGDGSKIIGYAADNAQQEGQWIAGEIARLVREEGFRYSDIALMYRANAQSRSLEEALINARLPYQLVGGTKFYERKEVKDAMAYLQAIANPADDVNLRRILNVPKRGLGARAEALLTTFAAEHQTNVWSALDSLDAMPNVPTRTAKLLAQFRDLMRGLQAFAAENDGKPSEIVAEVLEKSGLLAELKKSTDPQDMTRVDNLSQLQSTAAEFEQNTPDATLNGFLETTALVADSDQLPDEDEDTGKVTLMTLHTAKGLEYPVVFLTGMEQGTFPHSRAMENESELEEERRLAYVGITRARQILYVTRAAVRAQWGQAAEMLPSQFLDDIPENLIEWKRRETGVDALRGGWGSNGSDDEFGGFEGGYSSESSSYGSRPRWGSAAKRATSGRSSYGSYGSYGSSSSRDRGYGGGSYGSKYGARGGSSYGGSSYGSSYGSSSSRGSSSGQSGRVTTRRMKKDLLDSLTKAKSAASAKAAATSQPSRLNVADFHEGDRISHDQYGLGKVVAVEDKGRNSVITVDFGSDGVKRLLLRVAPIEKL
ncbi:UvrD-helicase domain-containing protein [Bifidobacterium sp. 82T24]|uniref:UvrD-helicase domain-containing protein n=1 Tax=Bifidobacterium pluvialisilvae TaxID=2834436 RepID=UPI001C56F4C7|nr:UvrD-helicase domain-containing protein [Bifidobacterium pluvialisilvae]MBW3088952.1 UvrD-helicase domain-containing protein [Bifidobacterium pluvialisilvae]